MIQFDPPELRDLIRKAYEQVEEAFSDLPYWLASDFVDSDHDDEVISAETDASEFGPYGHVVTIGELLEICNEAKQASLRSGLLAAGITRFVLPLRAADDLTITAIYYEQIAVNLAHTQNIDGINCEFRLYEGDLFYYVCAMRSDEAFTDHLSEECAYNLFAKLTTDCPIEPDRAEGLLSMFLLSVELSTMLMFRPSPFPSDFIEVEEGELVAADENAVLLPVFEGPGVGELAKIYLEASPEVGADLQILALYKVLEYVGATVARLAIHRELRARLTPADVARPTVDYLDMLASTVERASRQQRKAELVVEQAVVASCDPLQLGKVAPPFLRLLRAITVESSEEEGRKALVDFAACVVASRNLVSHAKPNYSLRGNECPDDQLGQLADCMRIAAQQAIRFFDAIPVDLRLTCNPPQRG